MFILPFNCKTYFAEKKKVQNASRDLFKAALIERYC